jgi:hypothetical protein
MSVSGACSEQGMSKLVCVREGDPPLRQRFTVAHETCHLLLRDVHHARSVRLDYPTEEELCDEFAGWLLVPQDRLSKAMGEYPRVGPGEVLNLCKEFKVTVQAMLVALASQWRDPNRILLSSRLQGLPRNGTARAYRVLQAVAVDYYLPRHRRLSQFGLGAISDWAPSVLPGESGEGTSEKVRVPIWRPQQRPRSGVASGSARWWAKRLEPDAVIAAVDLSVESTRWYRSKTSR